MGQSINMVLSSQNTPPLNAAVICIGVANVDIVAHVDTGFLMRHRVDKATSTLMRSEDLFSLIAELKNALTIPGGCAANTACGIATEGIDTQFAGMIHDDEYGRVFEDGFKPYGVTFSPGYHPEKHTALCLTLVTQDKERSFVFSPSAASWGLSEDNLPQRDPARPLIVYTESNLFRMTAGTTRQSMVHAVIEKYRGEDVQIILNLIDTEITSHHRRTILDMMAEKSFAYIISNQDELMALFSVKTLDEAFEAAKKSGQDFITTMGRDGAYIIKENRVQQISGKELAMEDVIDTVGAGDQFSAGFVAALAKGADVEAACVNGTQHAIRILGLAGARPQIRDRAA